MNALVSAGVMRSATIGNRVVITPVCPDHSSSPWSRVSSTRVSGARDHLVISSGKSRWDRSLAPERMVTSIIRKDKASLLQKFRQLLWKQTLIQHFEYTNLGRRNIFWWLMTTPFLRVLKIGLMPKFVKNGKLLEIFGVYPPTFWSLLKSQK